MGASKSSRDGGRSWALASSGLHVPWRRGMVEQFFQAEDELFAVLSNGQLLNASLSNLEWHPILTDITDVNAITRMIE